MNTVTLSYGLAAAAYALFSMLLLTSWQGRELGRRLIIACVTTAAWSGALAWSAYGERNSFIVVYAFEILRDAAWLYVVAGLARQVISRKLVLGLHAAWILSLAFGLALPYLYDAGVHLVSPNTLLIRVGLLLAFAVLVVLEQLYRNSRSASERALRYFVLGVGGLFVYDLFLFSQGELMQGINMDVWAARGVIDALLLPLIAIAVRQNPDWSLNIFVSRHVVFYTAAFVTVGLYLSLMAVGGFYVRTVGGTWGGIAQIFFFAGALIVLATLMFSQALRRRAKVFISKHFYRNKYDYRIEWLRFIQTLSSRSDEGVHRTALRAVAQIIGSPHGWLFVANDSGTAFAPAATWPGNEAEPMERDVSADEDFVRFLAERQWIIDLKELAAAPDLYQNLQLPEWVLQTRELRIVAPMLELDRLVGFFLLADPPPPFALTYEDRDLLKTVGRHVATHVAQDAANKRLAESRQFEAYNRLTAFLMHDLKNSVAQLSLLVTNAKRHKDNPEFIDDAIGTIANAVERMTRLIEQLQRGSAAHEERVVGLLPILQKAVDRCSMRKPVPSNEFPAVEPRVVADPERLGMVFEHVIRNAQEATSDSGRVHVKVEIEARSVQVTIEDTGAGMDHAFLRERLFRPFDSTKGSKGMGIGAYQAREYVRSLGGEVRVASEVGRGTRFSVRLPRADGEGMQAEATIRHSGDRVAAAVTHAG